MNQEEINAKARELVVRYYSLLSGLDFDYINKYSHSLLSENSTDSYFTLAKECALIAVNLLIENDANFEGRNNLKLIKQAIENL